MMNRRRYWFRRAPYSSGFEVISTHGIVAAGGFVFITAAGVLYATFRHYGTLVEAGWVGAMCIVMIAVAAWKCEPFE